MKLVSTRKTESSIPVAERRISAFTKKKIESAANTATSTSKLNVAGEFLVSKSVFISMTNELPLSVASSYN